jgi:hypothetical protein
VPFEIRQMLAGELGSRNIVPPPAIIEILAAGIAAGGREDPLLSRLHPHPLGLDLYFPGPGQSPAPAQVILDPDIAERMPWLLELPPGMSSARGPSSFAAWLEESAGTVVVCHSPGRIGTLSAADAEAYLPPCKGCPSARQGRGRDG